MDEKEKKLKTKKDKDEVQVTVSLENERKLQKMLEQISNGFDMARVTRKQVLAHVIDRTFSTFGEEDIHAVRKSTLTDMALLEFEFREIKRTGVVPEAIKEYLWKSKNLTQGPKRVKKPRQGEYSIATHKEEEAA